MKLISDIIFYTLISIAIFAIFTITLKLWVFAIIGFSCALLVWIIDGEDKW